MEPFRYDPEKRRAAGSASWFAATIAGEPAWVLDLPFATNPVPMNGSHGSYRAKARLTKAVRLRAAYLALAAGIPDLGFCQVQLTWFVRTRGRRDVDNLTRTLKALCDGLVDAGVVPDDVPALMRKHQNDIVRVDASANPVAWMELVVRPWGGLAADVLPATLERIEL
jgi:hypothetical protein